MIANTRGYMYMGTAALQLLLRKTKNPPHMHGKMESTSDI